MRSVWFFKRLVILVLGAALLGAPLLQTRVGSQNLSNHERDRSRVALAHSFQALATASDRGVLIEWRTGFEPDNLGFNVFRVANGQRTQLNRGLIAGSAVLIGQSQPGSYAWFDANGNLDSAYSIEAVDVRGQSTVHDAFKPVWSARLPERAQSELLEHPGASERAASKQTEWPETSLGSPLQTSLQSIGTETIQDQWTIIANQPALKIGVRADGWYRITQTEMAAAGFATSADARNLRLFVGGNEIAMRTSRDSGALTTSDYVEFWGQGLDLATTDTQIYWLVNGAQAGKRIAIAGEVNTNAVPATPATSPPPIAGRDTPVFWFGGVGKAEGSRQKAEGSEQKTVSNRGGNPTVREGAEAEGSKQLAVSSRGGNPTVREGAEAEGSKQKAEGSAPATIANLKLETQNSKLSPNSKLKTRNSKLRSHRRHSRSRRRNHATMALAAAPNFIYNVQRKDRGNSVIFFPAALNGDQENFFRRISFGIQHSVPDLDAAPRRDHFRRHRASDRRAPGRLAAESSSQRACQRAARRHD